MECSSHQLFLLFSATSTPGQVRAPGGADGVRGAGGEVGGAPSGREERGGGEVGEQGRAQGAGADRGPAPGRRAGLGCGAGPCEGGPPDGAGFVGRCSRNRHPQATNVKAMNPRRGADNQRAL